MALTEKQATILRAEREGCMTDCGLAGDCLCLGRARARPDWHEPPPRQMVVDPSTLRRP